MARAMKVFFDGGCRPNPGSLEIAVVAGGVVTIRRDLGFGTSEDAEWLALIHALTIARASDRAEFVLLGDAIGVVRQATGVLGCGAAVARHLEAFRALIPPDGPAPRVRYVKRSQNLAGIALAGLHAR